MADAARPLVSVIVATHNRSGLLVETVRSILGQTYRNMELIVVDDGSTDDTPTAIGTIKDERLRYVYTRNWGGPARPRNAGLALARGTFVAFCDDDDLWLPGKIERQVAILERDASLGMVYVLYALRNRERVGAAALPRPRWRVRGHGQFARLYLSANIPNSGVMARREIVMQAGGFDESRALISVEDSDLWLRLTLSYAVDYVPDQVLLHYRADGAGLSRRGVARSRRAVMALLRKHRHRAGAALYLRSMLRYNAYFAYRWLLGLGGWPA